MDETVKVAEITGPQAAELRAREESMQFLRDELRAAEQRVARLRVAVAIAESERTMAAAGIVRSMGLPDGPRYVVNGATGEVTAEAAAVQAVMAARAAVPREAMARTVDPAPPVEPAEPEGAPA